MAAVHYALTRMVIRPRGSHGDKCKQDRQCTHNVTLRRVREATVAVEKQYYIFLCVCVCARAYAWMNACV